MIKELFFFYSEFCLNIYLTNIFESYRKKNFIWYFLNDFNKYFKRSRTGSSESPLRKKGSFIIE